MSTSRERLETQIKGAFKGWKSKAVFELANGQTWQQTDYTYHYQYAYRPEVVIYRGGSGFEMRVEGMDDAVAVKRLK